MRQTAVKPRTRRLDADQTIMRLAASQHGLVTRAQLVCAGVPPDVVDRRIKRNWLRPVHRGIYQVGPIQAPSARQMAALLACGPNSAVSHRSAAKLWSMLSDEAGRVPVDVIVAEGDPRPPGVRVHRVCVLPPADVTVLDGLRITTPARTLCDIARTFGDRELEQALASALDRALLDRETLVPLMELRSGQPGTRRLRRLLECETGPALTRSQAEERFWELIRKAELPRPFANARIGHFEVDFHWKAERLVVEIDGFAFHSSRKMFERDRVRDTILAASGIRVIRITWRQLQHESEALLVRLTRALSGHVSRVS